MLESIPEKPDVIEELKVEGQTVPFYKYSIDGVTFIEFNTSRCGPPEPMINAMLALKQIKDRNTKVHMINHIKPMGLLPKIEGEFDVEIKEVNGLVHLLFSKKEKPLRETNFEDSNCDGQ